MYDDERVENALAFVEATQQAEIEQAVQSEVDRIYEQDPSVDFEAFTPYVQQHADQAAGPGDLPDAFDSAYAEYSADHAAPPEPPAPRTIAEATNAMMADLQSTRR